MNKKSIKFHVESGDYFGTLATIISLIRQNSSCDLIKGSHALLADIENDLVFLQDNFKIIKKH